MIRLNNGLAMNKQWKMNAQWKTIMVVNKALGVA